MANDLDLKQAALDIAKHAGTIFDLLDEGGTAKVFDGMDGALALIGLARAHDLLIAELRMQAVQRLRALGQGALIPEHLKRKEQRRNGF